ncbi:hypothetical protein [Caulobacter sp. X]|uniref:hypothetical protein n=1 Tax=Caulobacter sp. X TaxID=2048901 RepID=UPI001178B2A7|nr:hypothetical protein [Caulobacter sp. X]
MARLLQFFDDYDHGRIDERARRDYAELSARVEIATLNMEGAETEQEAAQHWNNAAADILRFLQGLDEPTIH